MARADSSCSARGVSIHFGPRPLAALGPEGNRGLPRGPGVEGGGAVRGGGRVQSPGRPGCRGMKPPPSPAEAFKYGRGPRTRGAAGGEVCGACGLGGRRCPRQRDLHRRCAPAWEVGKHRSPPGAPFWRPGCARGPRPLRDRGGAPYCTILVPLFGPGGNHVVRLQEVSRAGLLIRVSSSQFSSFPFSDLKRTRFSRRSRQPNAPLRKGFSPWGLRGASLCQALLGIRGCSPGRPLLSSGIP